MMTPLQYAIILAKLASGCCEPCRQMLSLAMRQHPELPWKIAISGLIDEGYDLGWVASFDGEAA